MLFLRMLFFVLCFLISASAVIKEEDGIDHMPKVLESCDKKSYCPNHSFCARRGCDGMICMCDIGYQPSQDFTSCLKVVELYRSCVDEDTRCRGPLAFCEQSTKTCRCIDGYIPAIDNIRCKKMPRYGLSYAMLNEECEEGVVVCQDSNQQICSSDTLKCTCRDGWKPASSIDLNAEPFILDECRPSDFSLDVELKECKKPIIIGLALVGQDCITDNNCPDKSKCKQIGCEKKQCRCVNGTAPTTNMENCKPGVLLHSKCNDSVVCLGAFVACIKGKCRCSHGSVEAINKQCKSKPPIPGHVEFAALGEECNDGKNGNIIKMCESAMCTEGTCRCPPTMREMTLGEILNNPNKFPTCVAIEELSEELSPAEYELRCVTLPNEMADLNRTGAKPGVTARWDEEPRGSTYIISEDNVEPAVEEFDESQVIEASAPNNSNNSVKLMDILMGNNGNDTISPDEIAEKLFSLNESLGIELVNASMGLNLVDDIDMSALNDTLNYLLTNDFDASDYNESFDAEFIPEDLISFNETIDSDSLNDTLDILPVNGSIGVDMGNSSLDLNSLNDSISVDSFNSSLDLDISNSTLDLENLSLNESSGLSLNESSDLSLNDSSGVDISNSSLGLDASNSSLETEGFNSSLSNSSFYETSLNDSLDFVSSNVSDSDVDMDFSNSSSSNETLDGGFDLDSSNESLALNMSAEVEQDYLELINESLQMNETADSIDNLLELFDSSLNDSLNLFLENFNQKSLDSILDSNAIGENNGNTTDGDFEFDTNDWNVENGSVGVDTMNGSLEALLELGLEDISSNETVGEESMNDTLANGAGELIEDQNGNNNATIEGDVMDVGAYLKKLKPNGTVDASGSSYSPNDTISNEGGMEETLQEESPDLGLAISDDGTHFIGSSGEQIEPVSYNNGADKDVDQVDELVAEGNFNNRKLLEKCNAMDVCPPLSQCLEVGCGPPICFCLPTYGPSDDKETCVPGAAQPLHCSDLDTYEEIQPNQSSDDTAPVAVATTLVCLGLILLLAVVIIYLRLNL